MENERLLTYCGIFGKKPDEIQMISFDDKNQRMILTARNQQLFMYKNLEALVWNVIRNNIPPEFMFGGFNRDDEGNSYYTYVLMIQSVPSWETSIQNQGE